ncbi:divalent metal cation transporter [Pseudoduganella sp. DS3]|uniref:Divalent metal cation transporter n=1 Tax=Pseudoduganella guangdongensis TaxID=2692179 RepID=A0A6N9HHV5_9BURK|nr:divalent metal cation transporter [Pseudoduganella guangdongensis]MYN02395.1 divalent metal cation transporter [Pseudoduganella guangdongensis]
MEPHSQSWLGQLGPGLVAGAADDDPSGIATYSQAGAQFGFGMLWLLLFTYPLMVGIQETSARIGRTSGRGLAANIRLYFPPWLLYGVVSLLLFANTLNIAADLAAMGDALRLVAGGQAQWYALGFGVLSLLLQLFIPYQRYAHLLKWLTLALLAYAATVLVIEVPWREVALRTVSPQLSWDNLNKAYLTTMVAVFGTTISPYLFFWQASQEVEELRADPDAEPLKRAPRQVRPQLRRIKLDTAVGMGFSNAVAWSIMLTTAVTLHAHGIFAVESSAQAAAALRPIAGELAFALFGLGIIGTGLLAIPVLAGSAAYAMAGAFNWRSSLELQPRAARKFYGILAAATLAGVGIGFLPLDPMRALYWSAVVNGVVAVPVMVVTMLLATRRGVMGAVPLSRRLRLLGWTCTLVMALAVLAMFASMVS